MMLSSHRSSQPMSTIVFSSIRQDAKPGAVAVRHDCTSTRRDVARFEGKEKAADARPAPHGVDAICAALGGGLDACVMSECRCLTPPFQYLDFNSEFIGVDETHGRFGEVSVEICKACGSKWLRYLVEYEAFTGSGRWYRGLVSSEELQSLTPERAVAVIEGLSWHFRGGSYFKTTGERGAGPLSVDL
jgi:hypothetical protein